MSLFNLQEDLSQTFGRSIYFHNDVTYELYSKTPKMFIGHSYYFKDNSTQITSSSFKEKIRVDIGVGSDISYLKISQKDFIVEFNFPVTYDIGNDFVSFFMNNAIPNDLINFLKSSYSSGFDDGVDLTINRVNQTLSEVRL